MFKSLSIFSKKYQLATILVAQKNLFVIHPSTYPPMAAEHDNLSKEDVPYLKLNFYKNKLFKKFGELGKNITIN